MIENVSTQLTVFHCFAHCLLPGRAFASLYVLLFLEKEAEIGGRANEGCITVIFFLFMTERGLNILFGRCRYYWSVNILLSTAKKYINSIKEAEIKLEYRR